MESDEARMHGRIAGTLTLASAALMALVSLASLLSGPDDGGASYAAWSSIIEATFIGLCGAGLLRLSRTAGLILFAYCAIAYVFGGFMAGRLGHLVVGLVFLFFYTRAIQESFAYHRIFRDAEAGSDYFRRLVFFLGTPLVLCITLLMSYDSLTRIGVFPGTGVTNGTQLIERNVAYLLDEGVIGEDEEVLLFYSEGLFSIAEQGSLLTDRRVISYRVLDDVMRISSATTNEIAEIKIGESPMVGGPFVMIWKSAGGSFLLRLSSRDGGDRKFIEEIERRTGMAASRTRLIG